MKTLLIMLSLGLISQVSAQTHKRDTIFLMKEKVDGEKHVIFIDGDKCSKFYLPISDFKFGRFDRESYEISLDYLNKTNQTLTKRKAEIPWTDWVTLKQYHGKFYVYHPCDFFFHFRQSINDTTFIDWTGEGPNANRIIEFTKVDSKTYQFQLDGIYNKDRELIIHIIDTKLGIAIFEQRTNGNAIDYYLMIAASKIRSVPVIVNYCPTQKQIEFDFEEPDYRKLLKSK